MILTNWWNIMFLHALSFFLFSPSDPRPRPNVRPKYVIIGISCFKPKICVWSDCTKQFYMCVLFPRPLLLGSELEISCLTILWFPGEILLSQVSKLHAILEPLGISAKALVTFLVTSCLPTGLKFVDNSHLKFQYGGPETGILQWKTDEMFNTYSVLGTLGTMEL
jgi:hypothetical protein